MKLRCDKCLFFDICTDSGTVCGGFAPVDEDELDDVLFMIDHFDFVEDWYKYLSPEADAIDISIFIF